MAFVTSSLDQWGASRQEVVATIAWVYGVRNTKFLYCFSSFNEEQERERETDRQTKGGGTKIVPVKARNQTNLDQYFVYFA